MPGKNHSFRIWTEILWCLTCSLTGRFLNSRFCLDPPFDMHPCQEYAFRHSLLPLTFCQGGQPFLLGAKNFGCWLVQPWISSRFVLNRSLHVIQNIYIPAKEVRLAVHVAKYVLIIDHHCPALLVFTLTCLLSDVSDLRPLTWFRSIQTKAS